MDPFGGRGNGGDGTRDFFSCPGPCPPSHTHRGDDGAARIPGSSGSGRLGTDRLDPNDGGYPPVGGFQDFKAGRQDFQGFGPGGGDGGCGAGAAAVPPHAAAWAGGSGGGGGRGGGGGGRARRGGGGRVRGGGDGGRACRGAGGSRCRDGGPAALTRSARGKELVDLDSDDDTDSDLEDVFMQMLEEDEEDFQMLFPFLVFGVIHDLQHYNKTRRVRGEASAHDLVVRLLLDPYCCYTNFRMSQEVFNRLHDVLVDSYGLRSTSKSSSLEALGMFLWMVGSPQATRQAETIFGRSLDTVYRNFHKVLNLVQELAADIIKPLDPQFTTIHPRLQEPRFKGLFNNCIGAIDGTHVKVTVDNKKVVQYMNSKGWTSQNVMAVVDFDLRFTFVLAGWPGSVHDMRVFNDAIGEATFPHPPPGKYYLVDSGYPNQPGYLAPYKGTKYHLQEYRLGTMPRGMKETFNYAHSSIRNAVDRAFGILKNKWRILRDVPSCGLKNQSKIICACMALHNFLIQNGYHDVDMNVDEEYEDYAGGLSNDSQGDEDEADGEDMNALRDQIAHALYY